jgi:hypothetical protein
VGVAHFANCPFCGITPAGAAYPQYDLSAPKASEANLVREFGEPKARFLQLMRILGRPVKTIELTYAIGEEISAGLGYSSGQVMQRLERSGLAEKNEREEHQQSTWSLTKLGTIVSSLVDQFWSPPDPNEAEARMRVRFEERAARLRGISDQELVPTNRAIFLVIAEAGVVATQSIPTDLSPFFHPPMSRVPG